jgi:NADH dehydrogenase FAD-containing subunit
MNGFINYENLRILNQTPPIINNRPIMITIKSALILLLLLVQTPNQAWSFLFQQKAMPIASPLFGASSSSATATNPSMHLVIVGGGVGGLSSAFDARHTLRPHDKVTVISDRPHFSFTPSNPWVAVGKRKPADIQIELTDILPRHNIDFIHDKAARLDPKENRLHLESGQEVAYDFLMIATGPRLAFEKIPGLKEHGHSICQTPHAVHAYNAVKRLVENPGPVVVGATEGASCFGPAYEYAFLLHDFLSCQGGSDLVDQCPITFVTPEPYIGHLGLDGAGDSQHILEELMRKSKIKGLASTKLVRVESDRVVVQQVLSDEKAKQQDVMELPSKLTMMIPPFHGYDVWKNVPGLTDPNGMILVNSFQQSFEYPNIFSVGVAVHMDPPEHTVIPIGVPKTGYMIESMGTAAIKNIRDMILKSGEADSSESPELHAIPRLHGLCITDFGETGAIFVTMPQIPPRRYDWTIQGKVATLAKIAFEKYFLRKIETGDCNPYYEELLLKLVGIDRFVEN